MNQIEALLLSLTEAQNARLELEKSFMGLREEHEKVTKEVAALREQIDETGQHRSGEGGDQAAP